MNTHTLLAARHRWLIALLLAAALATTILCTALTGGLGEPSVGVRAEVEMLAGPSGDDGGG